MLLNAVSASKRNALLLMEEHDHISKVCIEKGFGKIHVNYVSKDPLVLSVFKDYDSIAGDVNILVIDVIEGIREEIKFHTWGCQS